MSTGTRSPKDLNHCSPVQTLKPFCSRSAILQMPWLVPTWRYLLPFGQQWPQSSRRTKNDQSGPSFSPKCKVASPMLNLARKQVPLTKLTSCEHFGPVLLICVQLRMLATDRNTTKISAGGIHRMMCYFQPKHAVKSRQM